MTKKIIGICLIVLGCMIFLIYCYNLYQTVTRPVETVKKTSQEMMKMEGQLVAQGLSQEEIDRKMSSVPKSNSTIIIVDSIIVLISLGIVVGGFALLKKGMKDSHISKKFNFD